MRLTTTIQSLLGGLGLFTIAFVGMIVKAGALVFIITHFLPGLILGIILMTNYSEINKSITKAVFIILSTIIYIGCVFFVNIAHDEDWVTSIRLLVASSIGFVLLTLSFDFLITRSTDFKKTFFFPCVMGLISSLPSAFCMYYLDHVDFEQKTLETIILAGIFSIFPIWYYLFALSIKTRKKDSSQ